MSSLTCFNSRWVFIQLHLLQISKTSKTFLRWSKGWFYVLGICLLNPIRNRKETDVEEI